MNLDRVDGRVEPDHDEGGRLRQQDGPGAERTVADAFASGRNNFDAMRLAAALLVLASHAYVLTGHPDDEPVAKLLSHVADGGSLAVAMFFVLSGFLIARSAQVHPWRDYVRARALRIWPAFVVAVLLQTFVIGTAFTTLPATAYLADPATWTAVARALVFSPPLGLPGVFEANPLPRAVNGSLWTLRIEALCYAGLLALAWFGLLRRLRVLLPLAGGWALLGAVIAARAGAAPPWLASLAVASIVDCLLHFLMGAALWVYADRVPIRGSIALAITAAFAMTAGTPLALVALHLALPYLVLWLGLARPVAGPPLDISYGTYLYAFPVQQAVVAMAGPGIGVAGLVAMAAPLTLLLGLASRERIERPALQLRR